MDSGRSCGSTKQQRRSRPQCVLSAATKTAARSLGTISARNPLVQPRRTCQALSARRSNEASYGNMSRLQHGYCSVRSTAAQWGSQCSAGHWSRLRRWLGVGESRERCFSSSKTKMEQSCMPSVCSSRIARAPVQYVTDRSFVELGVNHRGGHIGVGGALARRLA